MRHAAAVALLVLLAGDAAAEPGEVLWAGHQVVVGSRKIPVIGTLETRTDTWVLARVRRSADEIVLDQQACRFDIAKVAGVHVRFLDDAAPRLPRARIRFRRGASGWAAEPWTTRWAAEDVDADGNPGATLAVDAPICSGTLHVGATSVSRARARDEGEGLRGDVQVQLDQRILGTSGRCLDLLAKDSTDAVRGSFVYAPVPAGTTCESLLGAAAWPVRAPAPERPTEARRPRPQLR